MTEQQKFIHAVFKSSWEEGPPGAVYPAFDLMRCRGYSLCEWVSEESLEKITHEMVRVDAQRAGIIAFNVQNEPFRVWSARIEEPI